MTCSVAQLERMMGLEPGGIQANSLVLQSGMGFRTIRLTSRHGKVRSVSAPTVGIGTFLRNLRLGLEKALDFQPHDSVHGCVLGRNTLTNAAPHVGSPAILRVDIRKFFPSIKSDRVRAALSAHGLDDQCSEIVSTCVTVDGALPLGFSTSPLIANLVFDQTDQRLAAFASSRSLNYTRYVDDLTFSGRGVGDGDLDGVTDLLNADGWEVQSRKTRFMRAGHAQYVTGLAVDHPSGPRLPRKTKRFLRMEVHYVTKHGMSASVLGRSKLLGMINYAKHVEPELGHQLHSQLKEAQVLVGWKQDERDLEALLWAELDIDDSFWPDS